MTFPFGRPVAVMIVCALACAAVVWVRPTPDRTGLVVWSFDDLHEHTFDGPAVRFELVPRTALDVRLASLFMAGGETAGPDLVEVEIGSVGKFLGPAAAAVGFLPLNQFLDRGGWRDKILPARLAPYTKGDLIFGIPFDLHPCTLTYRRDLFAAAGVDPGAATTWPQFQQSALRFQRYWADRGVRRTALGLSTGAADQILLLLQQRHVELVDAGNVVHLDDPDVGATVCWYARAAAGRDRIGADFGPGQGQDARDLADGTVCAALTADWSVAELKRRQPGLAGKLATVPLPRFDAGDARTASWGGTMIGIPRSCRQPEAAWRVIESAYLGPVRRRAADVLPPVPAMWADPAYHRPDPFFGGERVDELYVALAAELPARHMTPYTAAAQAWLGLTVGSAVGYVREHGTDDPGLDGNCRAWLHDRAEIVRRMVRFDRAGTGNDG